MDHATVAAGLMAGQVGLFLEQRQPQAGPAHQQRAANRQSDDPAADDRDVVQVGAVGSHSEQGQIDERAGLVTA